MEEAIELCRSKDTKVRMAGAERLHQLLESSRKPLSSSSEVTSVVDTCLDLLKDNNFRVSQGGLLALASAAVVSGDLLKIHLNSVVPAAVDRLGDSKQPVRDAARRLLVTLMQVSSPTIIVERAGSYAWVHKSWRVREEFARTVTSAINLFASTELPLQRAILPPILHMLNDPNVSVRDAAISCIEEMYTQIGPQFKDELSRHQLPSYMIKDINARLERIEPKPRSSDGAVRIKAVREHKLTNINPKRSSPKAKNSSRESSLFGGDGDATDIPVEPVKIYSDKELVREIEKIAAILVPEKDWSVRIGAMQRVEGLVLGGAIDYPSFRGLLKQLVGPLCTQLSDRRSSIVKQACHLLNFLSKELLGDFEACAEQFIPVLFKLVVITVLVIAESADNCIKTMLRNCKVARVLPRIADCAKNDKNAALRSRCCDYALLILDNWPDEPEIQRAADLYEDLIRRCVGDAVSEVRTIARACYRMFARTWPERSRRLFQSFDPVIQRIINEEDGGLHRRHASPLVRERNIPSIAPSSVSLNLPGYGTSAIVAMDKSATLASRASVSSGMLLSPKSLDKGTDGRLESVLNSSKEKVSAIENLLKGLDISSQHNPSSVRSSSLDLEVDPPSSRDPPFPFAVPASNQVTSLSLDSKLSTANGSSHHNGSLALSNMFSRTNASKDAGNFSYRGGRSSEPLSAVSSYSAKRGQERSLIEELTNIRDARRQMNSHMEKQLMDTPYRDSNHRESQASYVPNFQRPLSRKNVTGRSISSSRRSFDDSHLPFGEVPRYTDGPPSLYDALSEGLSSTSDWSARVAAFNCIRSLLQQGAGGVQEIVQSFEKVMKLFFKHLDDPHHKVAQSALLALADIIPSCRRPFESYVERILPHVFSRLVDPKELVRQPCTATLEIVSKTYGVDSLLPALLRSLDEQRSPKAKLAVIDFAIGSFKKHSATPEGAANYGILNLWLAKLTPLVHDKNTKLKEAATSCIISVYTHYDPTNVLNFILNLTVEEQNSLRRALKQYTPRIEVDLMNYLQSKKERQRSKTSYDPSDIVGTSSEEGYGGMSKKSQYFGRSPNSSFDRDGGRKWKSTTESTQVNYLSSQASADDTQDLQHESFESGSRNEIASSRIKDRKYLGNHAADSSGSWKTRLECADTCEDINDMSTPRLETNGPKSSENTEITSSFQLENGISNDVFANPSTLGALKMTTVSGTGPSIPTILHLISNGNEVSPASSKYAALRQLIDTSVSNDPSVWDKYFNQILTTVLEALDDSDSSVRELSLLLIAEMLKFQKDSIEDSVEIVLEKLLHISKDTAPKVANESENCLTTLLAQYDPLKCLNVIAPLLVTEDEKILVTSINSLTKLVARLTPEELTAQLPSFLPAIFDAFGNQSADVRKTVVFCLVDIYIMLGKAFMPYLEGLNSTQLRLVTIYANRISQARTGTSIDATQ